MLSDLDDVDHMGEWISAFLLSNSYEALSLQFQIVSEQMCCLQSSSVALLGLFYGPYQFIKLPSI